MLADPTKLEKQFEGTFSGHSGATPNTYVGSALVGAGAAYLFTAGSREKELGDTKEELEKSQKKVSDLDVRLRRADDRVQDLLKSKVDVGFELQNCLRAKDFFKYAHDNSFCLFRNSYVEEAKTVTVENQEKRVGFTN